MTDVPPLLLVIGDEPNVLTIVERFARQMGFEVETRANPTEALTELSKLGPKSARGNGRKQVRCSASPRHQTQGAVSAP
jgi:CheY-like chemotaxis protein